jgi:hypothetical protein
MEKLKALRNVRITLAQGEINILKNTQIPNSQVLLNDFEYNNLYTNLAFEVIKESQKETKK